MTNVEIRHYTKKSGNQIHIVEINTIEHTFDSLRDAENVRSYAISHNGNIPQWLQQREAAEQAAQRLDWEY